MNDIFDNSILCKACGKAMKKVFLNKNGFNLRAIRCDKCGETIVHPSDKSEYEEFMRLKNKEFSVKMRMVGNSYAVSIPREIVDFMHEQESMINNMVKMCFQDAGRLSLSFGNSENNSEEPIKSRIVKAREIKVVRNNKPVYHARQVYDSANPENTHTKIFKANKSNSSSEELEEEEN